MNGNGNPSRWRLDMSVMVTAILLVAQLISQWAILNNRMAAVETLERGFKQHELDTRHHTDPERDAQRWEDLLRRLERIDDKLDRLEHK